MKQIDKAAVVGRMTGIAIGAYFSKVILGPLGETQLGSAAITIIVIAAIVTFARAFEVLARESVNRSVRLRKFVCGRDYIEGHWIDFSDGLYGLITIDYVDGQIRVRGDAIDTHGQQVYGWVAVLSSFDGQTLQYMYQTTDNNSDGRLVHRFGYLTTSMGRHNVTKRPTYFSGTFVDLCEKERKSDVVGARISASDSARARKDSAFLKDLASDLLGPANLDTTSDASSENAT